MLLDGCVHYEVYATVEVWHMQIEDWKQYRSL